MENPQKTYANKALSQIPRLLSLQDRNVFSPTYGCFHRDYWLDKTSDFPDAVRQFGMHALALVYKCDFPGNIYKGNEKIRDWAIASLDFWIRIQHKDGSFDEFYPYERGWAGPTAFTTYTAIETFQLLREEIHNKAAERILTAIRQAAYFIARGESEQDFLANHHAMACLAVWKAYKLLGDSKLETGFQKLWDGFLNLHNSEEGWSLEYDGADPGYLSATVSFLAKIHQTNPSPEILKVLRQSIEFCSYFVYPNGFYGGTLGSRNTLHFYPHGFEIIAGKIPLAAAVAEKMLKALSEGKLVPPEIISDRYVFYRVPEYLQAYLDYTPRKSEMPPLPYEERTFSRYFPQSRIFVSNQPQYYVIANLSKGGVTKVFDRQSGRLLLNDCGLIGQLSDGRIITSQWIDPEYECKADTLGYEVRGQLQVVPSNKLFTPIKNLFFRGALILLGWSPRFAHFLKGKIRKTLMLGRRPVKARFSRSLCIKDEKIILNDKLLLGKKVYFKTLSVGDEFFVRYVPQSRYFQSQELTVKGHKFNPEQIKALNSKQQITINQQIIYSGDKQFSIESKTPNLNKS